MKENNVYYMQKAYRRSMISYLNSDVPIGCIITDKKNVVYETNNVEKKYNGGKHAEILCVDKLSFDVDYKKMSLYTTLIPCPMCSGYIYMKGIGKIYIGTINNNSIYNENFKLLLENRYQGTYLKNKCSYLLSSFFKKMR